ncbi:hypothetical protein B0H10DRAFT_2199126 [Mycena sp. CBHHK59/15]|nr:hypothetical protein B0H10DRAFT_2199126 [Mycena sp. CBHHK59/15]
MTDISNEVSPDRSQPPIDLIGAPFTVLETGFSAQKLMLHVCAGAFTSLARKLGIRGVELIELFDIEPDGVAHLTLRGHMFCFLWHKDAHCACDFADPVAERVWFANQLSGDACALLALLNIVFNCPDVNRGMEFRREMEGMSLWPADLCAALNAIMTLTLDNAEHTKELPPPGKRTTGSKPKKEEPSVESGEAYHFIGYIPAHGKVRELDGLKSGPLEVGDLGGETSDAGQKNWMDVVHPAICSKMCKYGGNTEYGDNIRFSLLALVDGLMKAGWEVLVDVEGVDEPLVARPPFCTSSLTPRYVGHQSDYLFRSDLLEKAKKTFNYCIAEPYSPDFGVHRMAWDVEILNMAERDLMSALEQCVREAAMARISLEDEVAKGIRENFRTHDYEPFLMEFVKALETQGLLEAALDGDAGGKKKGKHTKNSFVSKFPMVLDVCIATGHVIMPFLAFLHQPDFAFSVRAGHNRWLCAAINPAQRLLLVPHHAEGHPKHLSPAQGHRGMFAPSQPTSGNAESDLNDDVDNLWETDTESDMESDDYFEAWEAQPKLRTYDEHEEGGLRSRRRPLPSTMPLRCKVRRIEKVGH